MKKEEAAPTADGTAILPLHRCLLAEESSKKRKLTRSSIRSTRRCSMKTTIFMERPKLLKLQTTSLTPRSDEKMLDSDLQQKNSNEWTTHLGKEDTPPTALAA